ncbi:hypothetical protein KC327_g8289 [Hortaea werneckii]|uniref:Uncharacterized protein n=1 Tax=Hortaea werneckii EXF-2000 TaxID=1157616 RepID=A0A1Z5THT4_HORWE|nr:hypothetical protein KC358_g8405 [Hortaea werneckii]OTA35558.1 hypothetical protein BTJ68_04898 [Hortaea werneckii EXF-2000]KAI6829242.1 hypothetical protein KC350_g7892 [Hortaea werneckii]KAI6925252.1 hypothetical protein KC348_g9018 [Hortaea werneckii]KAI6933142.1 hypothetical protein KC341_g8493 [Hortaea werneckii]
MDSKAGKAAETIEQDHDDAAGLDTLNQEAINAKDLLPAPQAAHPVPSLPTQVFSAPETEICAVRSLEGTWHNGHMSDWSPNFLPLMQRYSDLALQDAGVSHERALYWRSRFVSLAPKLLLDPALFRLLGLCGSVEAGVLCDRPGQRPLVLFSKQLVLLILKTSAGERRAIDHVALQVAILSTWEKLHGENAVHLIHLQKLRELLRSEHAATSAPGSPHCRLRNESSSDLQHHARTSSSSPTPDPAVEFRSILSSGYIEGKAMPEGFATLLAKDLLPPTLLYNASQHAYWTIQDRMTYKRLSYVGISTVCLRPTTAAEILAMRAGDIHGNIAQYIRVTCILLATELVLIVPADLLPEIMQRMWDGSPAPERHMLTEAAWQESWYLFDPVMFVGTVYNEVLLWCLAMMYTASGGMATDPQICAMRLLISELEIEVCDELVALMWRFAMYDHLEPGLKKLWDEVLAPTSLEQDDLPDEFAVKAQCSI